MYLPNSMTQNPTSSLPMKEDYKPIITIPQGANI
jgi:hypothetical protein